MFLKEDHGRIICSYEIKSQLFGAKAVINVDRGNIKVGKDATPNLDFERHSDRARIFF